MIPQNIYRMSGGGTNNDAFEQLAFRVKHAFTALTETFAAMAVTESEHASRLRLFRSFRSQSEFRRERPYSWSKAWINPFTGNFPRTIRRRLTTATHPYHNAVSHRMLVEINDLNTTLNAGASYYLSDVRVTPHEYVWCQAHPECNMYNNVFLPSATNVTGTTWPFTFQTADLPLNECYLPSSLTGATINHIAPDPGTTELSIWVINTNHPLGLALQYAVYTRTLIAQSNLSLFP